MAEQSAARLTEALDAPFSLDGAEFDLDCSIGIALHEPDAPQEAQALIEQADAAVFRAKAVARGGWVVYESAPGERRERLEGSTRLRRALANEEFLLHYQPIFDVARGALIGVEALLRWNDPERGNVPPGEFIGLAEETGPDRGDRRLGRRRRLPPAGRLGRRRATRSRSPSTSHRASCAAWTSPTASPTTSRGRAPTRRA